MPYFKDTTPTWSTRGKLRRQLIPLLIDMYGNGCLRNLSNLAKGIYFVKIFAGKQYFTEKVIIEFIKGTEFRKEVCYE